MNARRNFSDLIEQGPEALVMVRRIAVLYGIEKQLRDAHADHDTTRATRKREAVPQLARNSLLTWLIHHR